ncbi:MAG: MATE family efflux transporter [Lachnospiraceae bacterium]|nr:MATE family efflux transporter [Lachnospiraceae bacterium]
MGRRANAALFEEEAVSSAVIKLAVPTIISSLVMVIYNLADTYFVGLLDDPVQTAAVTFAAPALLAFNAVNNLFGVGTSSAMSRLLGRGEMEKVKDCSAFGFYCALFCAGTFFLLTWVFLNPLVRLMGADADNFAATAAYMRWAVSLGAVPSILNVVFAFLVRSEGNSIHASIGTMSGCVLNMILDPIFILPAGLGMGAAGAGAATFLSNCVACLYFLVLLFVRRRQTCVCIDIRRFSFQKSIIADIFGVGIPASIQNLLNVTGMTVFNNFATVYGSEVVAAMGIVQKIQMVPLQITLGATQGIMPFVGYNFASGDRGRMKEAVMYLLKRTILLMVLVAAVGSLASGSLIALFIKNDAVVSYGSRFLIGFLFALPFACMDYTTVSVFQAVGAGRKSLLFAFLRKIVLEIPALVLLNYFIPLYGMPYASMCAEIVLSLLSVKMLWDIIGHSYMRVK